MELTFKDLSKAQKAALDLVNFGRVRIERCYSMKSDVETARIDVVYKLYTDTLWANDDLLKTLEKYSDDFEEDMAEIRRMLVAKDIVLNEILKVLENGAKTKEEIVNEVQSRLKENESLKVFASREAIASFIEDLEEKGFVIEDDFDRISLNRASEH
jgi:predicted nucleic-acid-binding protein